jgi:hypothetical protein
MMFIKPRIGVLLLRIASNKVYTWILSLRLFVISIWASVIFLRILFQCSRAAKQWDFRIWHGRYVSREEIVTVTYTLSAMTNMSYWLSVRGVPCPCR